MKRLLLALIRGYRKYISPARPPCCRFIPTCSAYALEAVEKYGAWKGGLLALRRLLKCHPFHTGRNPSSTTRFREEPRSSKVTWRRANGYYPIPYCLAAGVV